MLRNAYLAKRARFNSSKGYAFQASSKAKAKYIAKVRARAFVAPIVPGYTRRVGNYGRYSGAAAERKFFDTTLSFTIDATGEVPATGQLTLIPQGDTESTRDGRKATIKSVQIRGNFEFVPAAAATADTVAFLYLIQDSQCNGAAAAATDVFTSATFHSNFINLNNSGRFRILKKWVVPMMPGAGATTAYNNVIKQIEFFKSCNIPVDWSAATGAITEIKSNNLFLMAGSSGSDDTITFSGNCRLRFVG